MQNQLDDIKTRLDRIEQLLLALQTQKSKRIVAQENHRRTLSPELQHERVRQVESIFHRMLSTLYTKRKDSYRFPASLLEDITQPVRQAVLFSTLVNQCSLRKCFKPVAGEAGKSPADIAKEAIEDSNLIIVRIKDTVWGSADTLACLSPAEAVQVVKDRSKLPREWRGWTCFERMGITNTAVGPKKPPHDPSGEREWEGVLRAPLIKHVVPGSGRDEDFDGEAEAEQDGQDEEEDFTEESDDDRIMRITREAMAMPDDDSAGGDPFADVEKEVAFDRKAFEDFEVADKPERKVKIKLNIGSNKS